MTDPGELISGIFSVAVLTVVVVLLVGAFQGWDISAISQTVSSLAVPFIISLVFFSLLLEIVRKM